MSEQKTGAEVEKLLPQAVSEVAKLYLGDQLGILLGKQSLAQRDQCWKEAAQEFQPFSGTITKLRDVLKTADLTKSEYPQPVFAVLETYFGAVDDDVCKNFLTNCLVARVTSRPGYLRTEEMAAIWEAQAMATELGAHGDLRAEQMKTLTLGGVVKKVLTGNLKLTRQT